MASFIMVLLCLSYVSFCSASSVNSNTSTETYIVYVSKAHKPALFASDHHWYSSILDSLPPSPHPTMILYTYSLAINGFSAHLTPDQAAALAEVPGIISVAPEQIYQLHTTRTPQYLGLSSESGLWHDGVDGEDMIIGVLDTGVTPQHRSYSDDGLSVAPNSREDSCKTATDFPRSSCNKKLIGAKWFSAGFIKHLENQNKQFDPSKDSLSPRDTNGHGTHTSTTAASSSVQNAGFYEYAKGEARGMAVKARIAAYKVCWSEGCFSSDILAAFDQAIKDGVHVISMSLGSSARPYDDDNKAIGAFGATKHGIIVSAAAGNEGPDPYSVDNIAPWIITVGASTTDRVLEADVMTGNGESFQGASLYTDQPLPDQYYPLVYANDAGNRLCFPERLDPLKVEGKIVLCDDERMIPRVVAGYEVKRAGGVGMIVRSDREDLTADPYLIPAALVGLKNGTKVLDYINSNISPTAKIVFRGTVISKSPSSPKVATFSSRGPNKITPEILKPDVIAPGVNILAGWSADVSPSRMAVDTRRVQFHIISGTSMACPHVSGIAAVLKNAHKDWSPAAIKSALITTAYSLDNSGKTIGDISTGEAATPFVHGAGHVEPNAALNPGLIYDIDTNGYLSFLCAIGYTSERIAIVNGEVPPSDFCDNHNPGSAGNINYPTFSVVFKTGTSNEVKYKRTVKNVGEVVDVVYTVKTNAPQKVHVNVSPETLQFSAEKHTLSYEITFSNIQSSDISPSFGSIEWSDGTHRVRSPIAVIWEQGESVASI